MSAYRDIHTALTQSLIDLNSTTLGNLPIAYEGQFFDPTEISGNIFIDESYLFDQQESLTKTTLDEITGIYQLSVYQKSGLGMSTILDTVDLIIDNYIHNENFIHNGQKVVIINSGRNGGRNIDGWFVIDISINFKSDKLRA